MGGFNLFGCLPEPDPIIPHSKANKSGVCQSRVLLSAPFVVVCFPKLSFLALQGAFVCRLLLIEIAPGCTRAHISPPPYHVLVSQARNLLPHFIKGTDPKVMARHLFAHGGIYGAMNHHQQTNRNGIRLIDVLVPIPIQARHIV